MQAGIITARHGAKVHCADPGWPDICGYTNNGLFVGIEVKTKVGKASPEQIERRLDAESCGCIFIQVNGVLDCINKLKEVLR